MNSIDNEKFIKIECALQNYLRAMYEPPEGVDVDNPDIVTIHFVEGFRTNVDPAWIITFETEDESYRELILESELDFTVDEFKASFVEDAKWVLSPRDVVCMHIHRHPMVYRKE
jgi:hypothetical protein